MRTLLIILLCCSSTLYGQYSIQGNLLLDSTWNKVVYLSIIPNLEDMYKCSDQMIIAKAPIDEDGYFKISSSLFPVEEHLVRLHVSKKNDPPATLIIGGQNENHGFYSLSNNSNLKLKPTNKTMFTHFDVEHDLANHAFYKIDSILHYYESIDAEFSSTSHKNMVRDQQVNTLLSYADSSQHFLSALYAIHHADMGKNRNQLFTARKELAQRFPYHPYLEIYQLGDINKKTKYSRYWWGLLIFPIVLLIFIFLKKRKPPNLKLLSKQEIKVLSHLVDGKSNKEIAKQLFIESTTVKSHVYKIYSKLKISSRKEVKQFKKWVKKE